MIKYIFLILFFLSCSDNIYLPKPKAKLNLDYPEPKYEKQYYKKYYNFDLNKNTQIIKTNRGQNIFYPKMKATVYMSHQKINNNFDSLINDAYNLPYKHLIKAQEIPEKIFINYEKRVYGTVFNIVGDAASQIQFFLTDSTKNFLIGALYFYSKPNYDSIFPAVKYIERDLYRLIESFEWYE